MAVPDGRVPVIIVSYRTSGDVSACLSALDQLNSRKIVDVLICENGGAAAWRDLCDVILASGACIAMDAGGAELVADWSAASVEFRLRQSGRRVVVVQAHENLGYAGGINAWHRSLAQQSDWQGLWILNPDAHVFSDTLDNLLDHASAKKMGMVGSRVLHSLPSEKPGIAGLRWERILARTRAVPAAHRVQPGIPGEALPAEKMTAPSGASVYLSRACASAIMPLDEEYFLYFEDLDWGVRAQRAGFGVGHAHQSVIVHSGGGSTGARAGGDGGSELAIFLQFRNRLIFVRNHYPNWMLWTLCLSLLHGSRMVRYGRGGTALKGILAGWHGETGRPERLVKSHGAEMERKRAESLVRQPDVQCASAHHIA